jgi:hypothetical protein
MVNGEGSNYIELNFRDTGRKFHTTENYEYDRLR